MTETTLTVIRHYVEKGQPKAEALGWRWVRGAVDDVRGEHVDPGLVAKSRPLPAAFDPGLTPNRWVWIGGNDIAAKLPRPEATRGSRATVDGEVVDTVDHFHAEDSPYWDYYKLPLREGVELISEERFAVLVAEQQAENERIRAERLKEAEAVKASREAARESARGKLLALGLTDSEIDALTR